MDKVYHWIARRLLPARLLYWAAIVVMAHATTGEYSGQLVMELGVNDTLKRWEKDKLRG